MRIIWLLLIVGLAGCASTTTATSSKGNISTLECPFMSECASELDGEKMSTNSKFNWFEGLFRLSAV